MKSAILLFLSLIFSLTKAYSQQQTIWKLGKKNQSSAEFALAPDGKDKFIISGFGDDKRYFYAGENSTSDFPYIMPGTSARWAGSSYWAGQCRIQLPFLFKLSDVDPNQAYQWEVSLQEVDYEPGMFFRLEVNGNNIDTPLVSDTRQINTTIPPGVLSEDVKMKNDAVNCK